jgi:hypothetical protein
MGSLPASYAWLISAVNVRRTPGVPARAEWREMCNRALEFPYHPWIKTLNAAGARTLLEQVTWPLHNEHNVRGPAIGAPVPQDRDDLLLFFIVLFSFAGSSLLGDLGRRSGDGLVKNSVRFPNCCQEVWAPIWAFESFLGRRSHPVSSASVPLVLVLSASALFAILGFRRLRWRRTSSDT